MPITPLHLLIAGLTIAFAFGFRLAPREQLDTTVAHEGILTADTERILATAAESLKSASTSRRWKAGWALPLSAWF